MYCSGAVRHSHVDTIDTPSKVFSRSSSLLAGADTALLREVWQRAMRAEDRCNEALLEAWSATMTTSERLEVATQEPSWQRVLGSCLDS